MFVLTLSRAQATLEHNGTTSSITSPIIPRNNTLFGARTNTLPFNWTLFTSGDFNSAFGFRALRHNTTGSENSVVGAAAMDNNSTGNLNVAFGRITLQWNQSGNQNCAIGYRSLNDLGSNTSITVTEPPAPIANGATTNGFGNTAIGSDAGRNLLAGNRNVFLGFSAGPTRTPPETGVCSNRLYIHNITDDKPLIYGEFDNRQLKFNVSATNLSRAEITSSVPYVAGTIGLSGLRFTNLKSGNIPDTSLRSNGKVLTVDSSGDVVLVNGLSSSCSTSNFVPVNSSTPNVLACSQIFDNGTGVGVGYSVIPTDPTFFNYNYQNTFYTNYGGASINQTGAIKFHVNGNMRTTGVWQTSDKKFKKDIKPIENALKSIEAIDGKTYSWDREKNKEMNFDAGGHSGFLAQELEKVLPHLVITGGNGDKAVNYMELLPYLVEAIKEQQVQINELKAQASNSFKTQNGELLTLENTKIISVSPNPSNDVILVSMNIEKVVQNAKLLVHDINGLVLSTLNINERDTNITKTLQKDNFGKGIYIVSLVINGKSIDTKKIIFN